MTAEANTKTTPAQCAAKWWADQLRAPTTLNDNGDRSAVGFLGMGLSELVKRQQLSKLKPEHVDAFEDAGEATGLNLDPKWGPKQRRNTHVTVKPSGLMEWLVRLVTPPGGIVLDPFTGSGTTGVAALRQGFRFVGVEMVEEHVKIARARIGWAALHPLERAAKSAEDDGQASLFGKPAPEV